MAIPKPGKETKAYREQLTLRAAWALDTWELRPSLRYGQMKKEIQKRFECGENAAEQAIKRAYEILREAWSDAPAVADKITARYYALSESAERAGDHAAAIRAMTELRKHLGIGAADRVEHSGSVSVGTRDLSDFSVEELMLLRKAEERKKGP